ncbi:hypothetical protein DV736_g5786, partial [Chaetothyriales sp. CBS 134916]
MASEPVASPSATQRSSSPATTTTSQSQSQAGIYSRFHAHPFATDSEYQAGLSSILGHPDTPTTAAELDANPGLVLNTKLFYFAQKYNLAANSLDASGNKAKERGQEPPYPSSFSAIIDLITSNKPVPGIEQIPDTVLEHGSSKVDRTPRRRKPWEKEDARDSGRIHEDNADKSVQTGSGLLRILQPNAIPPSGLLANND